MPSAQSGVGGRDVLRENIEIHRVLLLMTVDGKATGPWALLPGEQLEESQSL